MTGLRRFVVIFFIMLTISLAAIGSGVYLFYSAGQDVYPPSVFVGAVDVSGIGKEEADKKISEVYENILQNDSFKILLENNMEFSIKYSEIDTFIDYNAIVLSINGTSLKESLLKVIQSYYRKTPVYIQPVVRFDKDKLKVKLAELKGIVKKEPVNADININDGKIVKIEEKPGQELNIDNTASKIAEEINGALTNKSAIELKASNKFEIAYIPPDITIKDFVNADNIISSFSTEIKNPENIESAKFAASAINKVLLRTEDIKNSRVGGEFSFNKYLLKLANMSEALLPQVSNEGFNQVASTLNAAIIKAGFVPSLIKTHDFPADYIELGLDAVIIPDVQDYKFKNTAEYPLIIFSEIKSNKVFINIVGKTKDADSRNSIRVDIKNKIEPSIVYVENCDLKQGEKRVIVPGRQGTGVKVYREIYINDKKMNEDFLYEVSYKATETIIQVGPGTSPNDQNSK